MEQRPLLELLELAEAKERLTAEQQRLTVEVGQKLKVARLEAGLSQSALAAAVDVTQPYVSQVENGTESATPKMVRNFYNVIASASPPTSTTEGEQHGEVKQRRRAKARAKA